MGIDQRRKLAAGDYSKIRTYLDIGMTKREIATLFHISTKYVTKIEDGEFHFSEDGTAKFVMFPNPEERPSTTWRAMSANPFPCSGCGYSFGSASGRLLHYEIWTSGGAKELDCMTMIMPMAIPA